MPYHNAQIYHHRNVAIRIVHALPLRKGGAHTRGRSRDEHSRTLEVTFGARVVAY